MKKGVKILLDTFIAALVGIFRGFAALNFLAGLYGILALMFNQIPGSTEMYIKGIYCIIAAAALMKVSNLLEKLAEKLLQK